MANIDRIKLPDNSEYDLQARVIGAVNGNVAVMDGNGNVADSGESLANIENAVVANLIPTRPLPDTNASNGVHWTTNTDGTVRIYTDAGGATADAWIGLIRQADKLTIPDGTFTASLNETTGISLSIFCSDKSSGTTVSTYALVTNSGNFTKSDGDSYYTRASLKVASGTVITTPVVIKPMLEVGLKAHSYVPYAPTNRELMLNKADASIIAPTEDGATASKAYAVGEHFIRGGKYCVCIAAITSGGTFTLNTNYKETNVGDGWVYESTADVIPASGLSFTGINASDRLKVVRFKNGAKMLSGLISVDDATQIASQKLFDLPTGYQQDSSRMGLANIWYTLTPYDATKSPIIAGLGSGGSAHWYPTPQNTVYAASPIIFV